MSIDSFWLEVDDRITMAEKLRCRYGWGGAYLGHGSQLKVVVPTPWGVCEFVPEAATIRVVDPGVTDTATLKHLAPTRAVILPALHASFAMTPSTVATIGGVLVGLFGGIALTASLVVGSVAAAIALIIGATAHNLHESRSNNIRRDHSRTVTHPRHIDLLRELIELNHRYHLPLFRTELWEAAYSSDAAVRRVAWARRYASQVEQDHQ